MEDFFSVNDYVSSDIKADMIVTVRVKSQNGYYRN